MEKEKYYEGIVSRTAELHKKARMLQERNIQRYGISLLEYQMIAALNGGEAPTQTALAAALGVDKALVTRHLAQLEEKGYIRRESNPSCRREKTIELTAQARELVPVLSQAHKDGLKRLFEGLEEEQLQAFQEILEGLIHRL